MNSLIRIVIVLWLASITVACEQRDKNVAGEETSRVLHRGIGTDPGSLDPALAEDVHAFNVLVDVYEGLVAEDARGALVPGVAQSWRVNDNGDVYTFELRPDARWSNGDPVLAADFVRSLQRAVAPETASSYAFLLEPILHFSAVNAGEKPTGDLGVRALSEHRLEIRLSSPGNYLLPILALPIAFPTHASGDLKISNGAYTLVDRVVDGPIQLRKNQQYWAAAQVDVEQIVYQPIADELAEFNMYRTGEIDITFSIPIDLVQQAKTNFGPQTQISPSLALYYIAFDLTEAPFQNNKPLRKALSMAIDREQLVALLGRGEQAAYSVVPPGVTGYLGISVDSQALSKVERERQAKVLFAQAGFAPDQSLAFKLLYDAGGLHERVALAVTDMWRNVLGVEAALESREWKYFLDTRNQRDEWDAMRFAWFGDYNSAKTFLDIFRSNDEQNLSHYSSSRYDELLHAGVRETDPLASANLMQAAEKELLSDQPIIPLYFFVSKHMVKPYIRGFEDNVVDRHPSRYLSFAPPESSGAEF